MSKGKNVVENEAQLDEEAMAEMLVESRRRREAACNEEAMAALQEIMEKHDCALEIVFIKSSMHGETYKLNFVAN